MKLKNETHYDTKDLKKLFYRCIREYNKESPSEKKTDLIITIKHSKDKFANLEKRAQKETHIKVWLEQNKDWYENTYKGGLYKGRYSGKASIQGNYMLLCIPKDNLDSEKLARLFIHEYEHNLGYHHNQTSGGQRGIWNTTAFSNFAWANTYIIRKTEPIIKPKPNIQLVKFERARRRLEVVIHKLKRDQALVKKWTKKVKYYEKLLTAAGKFN